MKNNSSKPSTSSKSLQETQLEYSSEALMATLEKIQGLEVLIIGDLMLDAYTEGRVTRISPEAPVPILEDKGTRYKLGGAGNVLLNLKKLGLQPILFSVVGDDSEGEILKELLVKEDISVEGIVTEKNRVTTLKNRIVSQQHQLLRMDRETTKGINEETYKIFLKKLAKLPNIQGVLYSDYAKGMFTSETFKGFTEWANQHNLYTALDPKEAHFSFYKNVSIMTPNLKEASAGGGGKLDANSFQISTDNLKALENLGKTLMERHQLEQLIITLSEYGMALFDKTDLFCMIPTFSRSVHDVSGAGDTVIAVYFASYLIHQDFTLAAVLANLAAGIAVSEFTTFAVSKEDIARELHRYEKNGRLTFSIPRRFKEL